MLPSLTISMLGDFGIDVATDKLIDLFFLSICIVCSGVTKLEQFIFNLLFIVK